MTTPTAPREHPEDRYQAELLSTEISARTARVMVWTFIAALAIVPMSQALVELAAHRRPQVLDVTAPVRAAVQGAARGDRAAVVKAWRTLVSREFPKEFEAALERASIPKQFVQPRLQSVLTGALGFGNDKGVVGRSGWLFYGPGLDYVTGPDFVDPETIRRVGKRMIDKDGVSDPQPDPRPALEAFHRAAVAAGIHLVVVPIPDKSMLQPDRLTARAEGWPAGPVVNNRGYEKFLADMRLAGVDVLDPTPTSPAREARYLSQDTHWTPSFMDDVSALVAARVSTVLGDGRDREPPRYRTRDVPVRRVGDLVDILKLPMGQTLFAPNTITVAAVEEQDGRPWRRESDADVLVLGDSFTNIFSEPAMGWGASAGFAEHLSLHLNRPVDAISLNGGATAVRQELARRAADGDRPSATRVIVYAFAARFLANEHWPVIPLALRKAPTREPVAAPAPMRPVATAAPTVSAAAPASGAGPVSAPMAPTVVNVEVMQTSKVPEPGTAPYKDCLTFVKLRVISTVSGPRVGSEIIGAFMAMRDNQWLPAATYATGDTLQVSLVPMAQAPRDIQSMQRADTLNDFVLKIYFVSGEKQ